MEIAVDSELHVEAMSFSRVNSTRKRRACYGEEGLR
jgi:hypothetical protein